MNEQQQQRLDAVNAAALLLTDRETKGGVGKGPFTPAKDGETRIEGVLGQIAGSGESLGSVAFFIENVADYIVRGDRGKARVAIDEDGMRIEDLP